MDGELKWRKRELTYLKTSLDRSHRQHEKGILLRVAVCLLYAHWEGFIKRAATGYLCYVATRGLRFRDLTPNFVALGFRSQLNEAGRSNLPSLHTELVSSMLSGQSINANLNWRDAVDAGSNLNSKTFLEILCLLGLDSTNYLPNGPLIDQRLLRNRNSIVHGDREDIQPEDYEVLHSRMIEILDHFRTDVENAAAQSSFRLNLTS